MKKKVLAVSHVIILTVCKLSALRLGFLLASSRESCGSQQTVLSGKNVSSQSLLHVSFMSGNAHTLQNMDPSGRHALHLRQILNQTGMIM